MKLAPSRGVGATGATGAAGANGAAGVAIVSQCLARKATDESVSIGSIAFDGADDIDTHAWHDPAGAHPDRLTVPAAANGKNAEVTATILTGNNPVQSASILVRRSSAAGATMEETYFGIDAAFPLRAYTLCAHYANLATGEYFTLAMGNDAGSSDVYGDTTQVGCTRLGIKAFA